MDPYEQLRLETISGDPIAYLAPNAEINRSFDNDTTTNGLPSADSAPLALDFAQWTIELTAQGFFDHSQNLRDPHRTALETEFGYSPVTARDQFNRLVSKVVFGERGPFRLYDMGDDYAAIMQEGVDITPSGSDEDVIYPAVIVKQIQPQEVSGQTREGYTIKFDVGVEQ